ASLLNLNPFSNSIMVFVVVVKYFIFSFIAYTVHRFLHIDSFFGEYISTPKLFFFTLAVFSLHTGFYLYGQPETSSSFIAQALLKMSIEHSLFMIFTLIVVLPIAEELYFRGAIMGSILNMKVINNMTVRVTVSCILPSVLFSLIHVKYDHISTFISLFSFSIIVSLARFLSKGILIPIFLHSFSMICVIGFGLLNSSR
ncbi:CPBP family intramembrane glutamic endopeptidase, partial [Vibrio owensii]|uniref:CPBP family intramembrane glutamic endopeptidase n=1 Tax=Vibrio owensii TaxID=696485 RepID=UPI003AACD051